MKPQNKQIFITKHAEPMQYIDFFLLMKKKNENFGIKFIEFFHIYDQNIDCWYTLEPPRWGGSNEYPQAMFWNKN